MKKIYVLALFLIMILAVPFILWQVQPEEKLPIAIIDKTVTSENYREHLGLTWLLKNLKYTNGDGATINAATDYFGFVPNEQSKSYTIRDLPKNYNKYDVIYLADTYGVYEKDLPWVNKETREGSRSKKIYGGLEMDEWQAIEKRLNQKEKSLLIAEYNTFASPTNPAVRERVTKYLGLDWSGWTGRYFEELNPAENEEIPQWILDKFGDTWNYKGGGFVLVNDFTYEVLVLEKDLHLNEAGIRLSFTNKGKEQFNIEASPNYQYWFDIVTPKNGATVLANYEWNVNKEGKQLLEKHQIPSNFAAVIKNEQASSTSYYFAGDYNDTSDVPYFYKVKGIQNIYSIAQSYSEQAFYWKAYVPMMETILQQFEQLEIKQTDVYAEELQLPARVNENQFEVLQNGKWTPFTLKGVNIGMAKPGTFPGEADITEEEYYRWFEQIGEMNANTIRVYTLHPPGFYNALERYNESHKEKIYVLHGVWINEESLEHSLDAFEKTNMTDFQNEMKKISDAIHGNAIVEEKVGHASGIYEANISEYVIGWILGIEWYPLMVDNTNKLHKNIGEYKGTFFETKNAQPFEHWLAMQMDQLAQYEMKTYHSMRPMSFTNWPTTDLLEHPSDATENEDLVSVNPNVIYTKDKMDLAGQFASYHIYPYYPDFMHYDKKYQNYIDHRGELNSYAGYLNELKKTHRLPILVAEFGIPSSRGLTHTNKFGKNQGFMTEQEQGQIISGLYEDIMAEKMLGGLIFTWQDEWFKRTWNTMDYDDSNRRPYWSNAQTNEQQFGLLSFDRNKIHVDGDSNDWSVKPLYEKQHGDLKKLFVDHDEKYLYLRLDYDSKQKGTPKLLLDTVPAQGNQYVENTKSTFANGVDFLIDLNKNQSRILVDEYYDMFFYQYKRKDTPKEKLPVNNSGKFTSILYALNKEYYNPEEGVTYDFITTETGKLRQGNSNPQSKNYDSLADYYINDKEGMIELRIPWLLIQAKDPSQKTFTGDLYKQGLEASTIIEQLNIGVLFEDEKGTITDSLPEMKNDQLPIMSGYKWENWDQPLYKENLKQSYYMIQKLWDETD